jgi:type I restriction enzyme S subunit
MFGFPLRPEKFLSHQMTKLPDLMVPEGWIVVSRSGTVGNVLYVGRNLAKCAVSDHAIRIEPTSVSAGYLCAYLASDYGRRLMAGNIFGATVEELEPKHIGSMPLPRLGGLESEIGELIIQAYALRDRADDTLREVEDELYDVLGVGRFNDEDVQYIGKVKGGPRAFQVQISDAGSRLDASYHIPVVRSAIERLRGGKYPLVQLGTRVSRIYVAPRFARIYVPPEYGVPLLQGSQLPLIRANNLQYISSTLTKGLDRWIIQSGWVLVTCSGTIGRVAISTKSQDGWAASQHILRIVPDLAAYHPGFLWAFLRSEYGQHQLQAKIYGGVIDELTEDDTAVVAIPDVPMSRQKPLGAKVLLAYEQRDEAQRLEDLAISRVNSVIATGAEPSNDIKD